MSATTFNLGDLFESIADAVPGRDALVCGDVRRTFAELDARASRLAHHLASTGIGPGSHVGLYLSNCAEYVESMIACFKLRGASINVNFRYVEEELRYLLDDAKIEALVFPRALASRVAAVAPRARGVRHFLVVEDGTPEAPLGLDATRYEDALAAASPKRDFGPRSNDDHFIIYTGGTTGMPKGVLWRQADIYTAALGGLRPRANAREIAERARDGGPRVLPAPPFMHGAAHWAAFSIWHAGGAVVVQSDPRRLDPHDLWSTVERERVSAMTIVGDAFARPLLDALAERTYDLSSLTLLTTGGAILTAAAKDELLRRIPQLRILDTLGSSESGAQATQVATAGTKSTTGDFAVSSDSLVLREDLSGPLAPGTGERGWLARRGVVPLGYYGDPEKTARTFPVIDGVRYSVPGDRATIEADGTLRLLGRDSVTINTGGEKVFAEEVEHALKHHPGVFDAVVVGTPHARFGQQVTAIVRLRAGASADEASLRECASEHLAAYKLPRAFVFVDEILRSPSGKADYRWAKETATRALGG